MSEQITLLEHFTLPKNSELRRRIEGEQSQVSVDFSRFDTGEALQAWKYPETVIVLADIAISQYEQTTPDDPAVVGAPLSA